MTSPATAAITSLRERLTALPPRPAAVLRWSGFLLVSWIVLWPALTITISGDDFINPVFVFDDYGPSPFGMIRTVSRDLTRAGHFNYLGQNIGAVAYVAWAYLMGWGLRYSFVYALTKFVVFIVAALVAARLYRTLSSLAGRDLTVWRSRVVVAAALFLTVQIHVAWSSDPVASFPLSGYLAAAVGLGALDAAIRCLGRTDARSLVIASSAFALAVLYYEINVAVVVALVPIVLLRWLRAGEDRQSARVVRRRLLVRSAVLIVPTAVMTVILQGIAASANRGYTGTDVAVGNGTGRVLVRSLVGSLPVSSWRQARRWLDSVGRHVDLSMGTAVIGLVAIVVVLGVAFGRERPADRTVSPSARRSAVLLLVAVPLVVWFVATGIQATTEKVRAETIGVGFVYNYYAYGSIGVVLAVLLVLPAVTERAAVRRLRPVGVVLALVVAVGQVAVNSSVQRAFDDTLGANDRVLAAFSDQLPEADRCATVQAWAALPFWQDYYRAVFVAGLDVTYQHFHDEPFCSADGG